MSTQIHYIHDSKVFVFDRVIPRLIKYVLPFKTLRSEHLDYSVRSTRRSWEEVVGCKQCIALHVLVLDWITHVMCNLSICYHCAAFEESNTKAERDPLKSERIHYARHFFERKASSDSGPSVSSCLNLSPLSWAFSFWIIIVQSVSHFSAEIF